MNDVAATSEGVEEILTTVPIFSRLGKRDLKKLAKLCVPKTFDEGEILFEEGATGLGLFLITSGSAETFKGTGDTRTVLGTTEKGDVLGEIALIDNQPRSASAVAQTKTECLLLTRDSFEALVRNDPEIAWCLVPSLAERVRELHARALEWEERLSQTSQPAAADQRTEPTGPETPEAEAASGTDPGDKGESEDSDTCGSMARGMRMPYAMAVTGFTGMAAMAKMGETFFRKLADETELRDSDDLSAILNKAPDGFVSATREVLSDMEKMPQDMVDSFRDLYKEE